MGNKISKVDHTQVAYNVPVRAENGAKKGVLYKNPTEAPLRDLKGHIDNCVNKSMGLYKVYITQFSRVEDEQEKQTLSTIAELLNAVMGQLLYQMGHKDKNTGKMFITNQAKAEKNCLNFLRNFRTSTTSFCFLKREKIYTNSLQPVSVPEGYTLEVLIHFLAVTYSRGTLRIFRKDENKNKRNVLEILEKLSLAICSGDQYDKIFSSIPRSDVKLFIKVLYEDYTKSDRRILIRNSIEKQVAKLSVVPDDTGNMILRPSFAEHKNKHYLFDYLKAYAAADETGRDLMLVHMRELILLFLSGPKVYKEIQDLRSTSETEDVKRMKLPAPWTFGFYYPEDTAVLDYLTYGEEQEKYSSEDINALFDQLKETFGSQASDKKEEKENLTRRKELYSKIREMLNSLCVNHYKIAKAVLEEEVPAQSRTDSQRFKTMDLFWINYISESIGELFSSERLRRRQIRLRYLCEYVWKKWKNLLAEKYRDLGKGVYHFSLADDMVKVQAGESVSLGYVQPEFHVGISSFEYERIAARDHLDRSLSGAVTCAVDAISRSAITEESREIQEDSLIWTRNNLNPTDDKTKKLVLKEQTVRNLLRFFGGLSVWEQAATEEEKEKYLNSEELFFAIKDDIYSLRNAYFHYSGVLSDCSENQCIRYLFNGEAARLETVFRQKYFGNNVHKFYASKEENITELMNALYAQNDIRPAQIPAFKNVLPSSNVIDFICDKRNLQTPKGMQERVFVARDTLKGILSDKETTTIFKGTIYFLLKEIYYRDFLHQDGLKEKFIAAKNAIQEEYEAAYKAERDTAFKNHRSINKKIEKNNNAMRDFSKRVDQIISGKQEGFEITFGEICQALMIEYKLQNGNAKVDTGKRDHEDDKPIYQHYRELLYVCLNRMFWNHLVSGGFGFLRNPKYTENKEALMENLWTGFSLTDRTEAIRKLIQEDPGLRGWYVAAHFLVPKQLNHLIGDVKNYIQFIENIEIRSALLGNRQDQEKVQKQGEYYQKLLSVLGYVQLFCGHIGQTGSDIKVTDYFTEEEYLDHLAKFVDYRDPGMGDSTALKCFSTTPIKNDPSHMIGFYHDGTNPIIKRHVVRASMYGNDSILSACMQPVTLEEIQSYYDDVRELSKKIDDQGVCESKGVKKSEKELQLKKNRIDLLDVTTLTEMISDFLSQLVSWSYLRERDLMYFQLGFHYMRLFYGNGVIPEDSYLNRVHKDNTATSGNRNNGFDIQKGAVLYQIAAMYTFTARLIERNPKKADAFRFMSGSGSMTSVAVSRFAYSYCRGDESVYYAGLELFENRDEEKALTDFRNYIDHFHYLVHGDRSILDLYSEIYDRFFSYDRKYAKRSVTACKNILARYFVDMDLRVVNTEIDVINGEKGLRKTRKAAMITISEKEAEAVQMTYPVKYRKESKKGKTDTVTEKVSVPGRNSEFLKAVTRLLEYRNEEKTIGETE